MRLVRRDPRPDRAGAAQYLAPAIADVVVTLSPAQIANIEKRFAATNEEYREDHLQKSAQRRLRAEVKREVERAEMLYGRLDAAQRDLVAQSVAASPYDAELAFSERKERQRDVLALVRRLRDANVGRDDALVQVRAYLNGIDRSPRRAFRRYAERLAAHRCALASELHNGATAAQRGARSGEEARRLSRRRAQAVGRRRELEARRRRRRRLQRRRLDRDPVRVGRAACGRKSRIAATNSAGSTVVRPVVGPWLWARAS